MQLPETDTGWQTLAFRMVALRSSLDNIENNTRGLATECYSINLRMALGVHVSLVEFVDRLCPNRKLDLPEALCIVEDIRAQVDEWSELCRVRAGLQAQAMRNESDAE